MFAVCVKFTVKPGLMPDFMPLMRQQARDSAMREPGCRRFDICSGGDAPETVFLYEIYDDAAAFQDHLDSAHFKAFDSAISALVAAKSVWTFPTVEPTA